MANLDINRTLSIVLPTLREFNATLPPERLESLRNIGNMLEMAPEDWEEEIEPALMTIIENDEELKRIYQANYFKLNLIESTFGKESVEQILPTWQDIEKLNLEENKPITFGIDENNSVPIIVAASQIFKSDNPKQLITNSNIDEKFEYYFNSATDVSNSDEGVIREDIDKGIDKIQPRYINTGFYQLDHYSLNHYRFVDTQQPLALEIAEYILKVNVGKFWGIGSPDTALPEELLEPFFEDKDTLEMDVILHSFDVEIISSQQRLKLSKIGDSEFIDFPVTFTRTQRQSIDIDLMFHGYLLQSKRVEVYVVEKSGDIAPESAFPVQDAYITWTRSATLNPDELTFLKKNPRRLTIVTERDIDYNRIGLRFYDNTGKDLGCQHSQLTNDNLTQVLAAIRTQLCETMVKGYGGSIGSTEEVLTKHLGKLADIGRSFYTELLPKLSGQKNKIDRGENLRVDLQPKTIIQVAPLSSQLGVPWELLYERKIESYREGKIKLCPTWKQHGANPEDCPSYGTKEEAKTVCPHSFWGYRYIIEQLPCKVMPHASTPEHSLPLLIRNQSPLQFKAIVSNELNLLDEHWQNLRNLASKEILELLKLDSLDKVESALFDIDNSADILYFYTHGGSDIFRRPYLEVGDGEQIKKNDLDAWNINFNLHQPLIVLNACDSAGYSPESFENLLQFFHDKGAAGVIGTQCEVKEMLANELMIHFFKSFFQKTCAGEALFQARKILLNQLDPRGLVYSLFASADVKLAQELVK